jgi:hypothetical protein
MDSVVQYILDQSHLEVTLIRITDATDEYVPITYRKGRASMGGTGI